MRSIYFSALAIDRSIAAKLSKYFSLQILSFAALLLVMVSINSLVTFGGRSRIPSAPTLSTGGLNSQLPYGYKYPAPANTIENDMGGAFNASYNYDQYLRHSLLQASIPLWDPHLGFGMPHLGNGLSAVLYPLNWLHIIVLPKFSDLVLFLNWALGAAFLTMYLKLVSLDYFAASFGGLVVICSGWFSGWLGLREITGVAAWFPFLLYAVERTIQQPKWRLRFPALALGVFCTITAGHPEAFIPSFLVLIAFGLFRSLQSKALLKHNLTNIAAGATMGILLAAPMWLTFIETIRYSHNPHEIWTSPAGLLAINPHGFAGFIFPFLFGTIHHHEFLSLAGSEYTSPGWLPPVTGFFIVASLFSRRRGLVSFFLITLVLVGLKIWSAPWIQIIGSVPGLSDVIWPRYGAFLLTFAAAILTAIGFEKVWRIGGFAKTIFVIWFACVAVLGLEVGYQIVKSGIESTPRAIKSLGLGITWALLPLAFMYFVKVINGPDWKVFAIASLGFILPATAYDTGGFIWDDAILISSVYLAVLVVLSALIITPRLFSIAGTAGLIACATAIPVLVIAKHTNGGPPRRYDVLTPPPYIKKLTELQQGGLYRTMPFDGAPMPNVQTALGLPGISWIVPLVPENFYKFFRRFLDSTLQFPNWYAVNVSIVGKPPMASVDELHRNMRFFSMAAVRYITTQYSPVATGIEKLVEVFPPDPTTTRIFENQNALPRLFLAPKVDLVRDTDDAWSAIERINDLSREVVAEKGAWPDQACNDPYMTIKSFDVYPNSVRGVFDANCTGMLVLSDLYLPGWHVTLDGEDQMLYRVNGIFRGVQIGVLGSHTVQFWYRPQTFNISLMLAALGFVAAGAGSLIRRKDRPDLRP